MTEITVCPYCGTLPEPVALQRADGTFTEPDAHADHHADDCPYYLPTVQPIPYGSASIFS